MCAARVARLGAGGSPSYTLAPAGEQLVPTLTSLWRWAEHWVPADPAMAQADPTVIMWWLTHRVDVAAAPERQVVLDLAIFGQDGQHSWLLIARNTEPALCLEDPLLDPDRYVYVEADAAQLYPIARGLSGWRKAIQAGSVTCTGIPCWCTTCRAGFSRWIPQCARLGRRLPWPRARTLERRSGCTSRGLREVIAECAGED